MELRYPFILIFGILFIIGFIVVRKKKKTSYSSGKKIANTNYIKETIYYKKIIRNYKILLMTSKIVCLIAILISLLLLSRPTIIKTIDSNSYSRDIFLCMDVSSSVDELNYELVENLKATINELKGERFGISIFNSSSVTLVPLTDDYDYVLSVLDKIGQSIEANYNFDYNNDNFFYTLNYIISGTDVDYEIRGSSLIGEGLASCVYSFSNLDEERTRIIIFSTDNDLQGNSIVTLDEAAIISKNKNIIVYGIGTESMNENDRMEFKNAVEKTGGIYYDENSLSVKDIVSNIEKNSKSLLKEPSQVAKIDNPQIPFIMLIFSIIILIIINKKVML